MKTIPIPLRSVPSLLVALGFLCCQSPFALGAPGDVEPGFNPNLSDRLYCTAMQPDGKILLGGQFASVGGQAHNYLARLNADGTLDTNFNATTDGPVYSLTVQADGKIVLGGYIWNVNGQRRNYLARLNADGTLDTDFDPNANGYVYCTAMQPDGKLLVGGEFTGIGGQARNYVVRLNADGTLDTNFNPVVNNWLYCLAVQPDGKILIGGGFTSVNGQTRNYVARLNGDGSLDSNFDPNANNHTLSLAVQPDGKILLGGYFFTVGGGTCHYAARLNGDGTLDSGFNPGVNRETYSLGVQADGKILLGGSFDTVRGQTRNYLARLNGDGTLDTAFNPNANFYTYAVAVQADGKVLMGGYFTTVGGQTRHYAARLENDAATQSLTVTSASRVQWLRGGASPEAQNVTFELSINNGASWSALGAGVRIAGGWELAGLNLPESGQVRARARVIGGEYNGSSGLVETTTTFLLVFAPTVATGTASNLLTTGATLTGTVTANGADAAVRFDYGLDTNYGQFMASAPALVTGRVATAASALLSGLAPHTTYHYRVMASNSVGAAYGDDATFTTANTAPAAPTLSPGSVAENEPVNASVGTLGSTTDPDGDAVTYTLVSGSGDADNGSFTVAGNTLQTAAVFDYETKSNYAVRVRAADAFGGSAEAALTVSITDVTLAQVITFGPLAGRTFGDAPFLLSATGGASGQPVTFRIVSGPATLSSNRLTITGAGVVTVRASQAGAGDYAAAADVDQSFTVAQAPQTITFNPPATAIRTNTVTLTATGGASGNPVVFSVVSGPGELVGNDLTFTGVGAVVVRASQAGNANYAAAVDVDRTIMVYDVNAPGQVDIGFNPNLNERLYCTAVQPDGKILLGGQFTNVSGQSHHYLARLNADGTLDTNFNAATDGFVYSLAVQTDGKIVLGGAFREVNGQPRGHLARLNSDGTLDAAFDPNANATVYCMAVQPDGKILTGGNFDRIGGQARTNVARLNTDGTVDPNFNPLVIKPDIYDGLYCVAVQPDGKILLGGGFGSVNGQTRSFIARLNADGTLDAAFDPNANGFVYCTAVQPDGKILLGGYFTTVSGASHFYLARLNADGTVDTNFNASTDDPVYSLTVQTDGKIVLGGNIWRVNGQPRNYIARLNGDGTLDAGFNPDANSHTYSVALQADGKILMGGLFTTVGGQARNRLARLMNEAAPQSLTVPSANRVEWLRGGTSPEAQNVTFELSTNNGVSWSALGAGVRMAGGWELTGLNLQGSGQVRARARVIGGEYNGSSGLVEATTTYLLPSVPTVVTGSARDLLTTGATLTGTVTANGADATVRFAYGLDTNYGQFMASAPTLVTGRVATAASALLSGLAPHTTYHYRAMASNSVGAAYGDDATFTTANTAPAAPMLSPGSVAENEPVNTPVGTLGPTTDPDGDAVTCTLVSGSGDTDNGSFTISGNTLRTAAVFDYETKNSYAVRVRAADAFGGSTEAALTVSITDVTLAQVITFGPLADRTFGDAPFLLSATGGASGQPVTFRVVSGPATLSSNLLTLTGAGSVTVRASQAGAGDYAAAAGVDQSFTVARAAQTIIFNPPASAERSSTVTLEATGGDSGNPVVFSVFSGPGLLTGNALTFTGIGTVVVRASQAGNTNYAAAADVDRTITVYDANAPGQADPSFNPGADDWIYSTVVRPDGKMLLGGRFTLVGGQPRYRLARLNADGTLDPALNLSASSYLYSIAVQGDGKVVIAGDFYAVGGQARPYVARLNTDDTLDAGFNPSLNGAVVCTALQPDGKLVLGGYFSVVGGQPRLRVARLNTDGTLDADFNDPEVSDVVACLALQTDGKMLIGGYFTAVGSQPRNYLARLNGNGTLDTNFTATTDGPVYTLAVQADGRIVVGGGFATAGGAPRNNAARLQADGSLDTGFNPNADAAVFSAVLQADGKLLLGGPFTAIGGQPRHRIARLNADGSLDATFNPDADSGVFSLAMQADGKVILGGAFTAIGGQPYNRLARLSNDTATQSLTVPSPSRVQWLRGGAAPEAQDVAFELSTDGGASWTALGAGVRIAGGWELAGLSLQGSGQVRARARVVSGIQNGSSGLVEAVAAFEFASAPRLTGVTWLGPGSFRFGFTNAPGLTFTTLVSTNLLLPLNQWTNIGPATEVLPGQYQFTVTDALSRHHCFYSVRSP